MKNYILLFESFHESREVKKLARKLVKLATEESRLELDLTQLDLDNLEIALGVYINNGFKPTAENLEALVSGDDDEPIALINGYHEVQKELYQILEPNVGWSPNPEELKQFSDEIRLLFINADLYHYIKNKQSFYDEWYGGLIPFLPGEIKERDKVKLHDEYEKNRSEYPMVNLTLDQVLQYNPKSGKHDKPHLSLHAKPKHPNDRETN